MNKYKKRKIKNKNTWNFININKNYVSWEKVPLTLLIHR